MRTLPEKNMCRPVSYMHPLLGSMYGLLPIEGVTSANPPQTSPHHYATFSSPLLLMCQSSSAQRKKVCFLFWNWKTKVDSTWKVQFLTVIPCSPINIKRKRNANMKQITFKRLGKISQLRDEDRRMILLEYLFRMSAILEAIRKVSLPESYKIPHWMTSMTVSNFWTLTFHWHILGLLPLIIKALYTQRRNVKRPKCTKYKNILSWPIMFTHGHCHYVLHTLYTVL